MHVHYDESTKQINLNQKIFSYELQKKDMKV